MRLKLRRKARQELKTFLADKGMSVKTYLRKSKPLYTFVPDTLLNAKKPLFAIVTAVVTSVTSFAQQPAFINNSVAWDPSPSPNLSVYVVMLTTNRVAMGTNGYVPPPSAVIQTDTVPAPITQITITNLWPAITNGTYSVFVTARNSAGQDSITSSNLVFTMFIPPLPVRNLRLQ